MKKRLVAPVKTGNIDWIIFYALWFIWVVALPIMYIMAGFKNRRSVRGG